MRSALWVCVCACFLAFATVALADDGGSGPAVERAAEIFRRANGLYDQGKLAEAEVLYVQAWQIHPSWDIATNLAACALDLGKHREAATYFLYALKNYPARGKVEERKTIETRLAVAKAKVVSLTVRVNVEKADVAVNGAIAGSSPLPSEIFADPGRVQVEVRRDGHEPATQTFEGKAGEAKSLSFTLVRRQETVVPRSQVPAYVGAAVGFAGLVAGAAMVGVAESRKADLASSLLRDADGKLLCYQSARPDGSDTDPKCASLRTRAAEVSTLGNAGVVSLIAGSAFLAGAAVYYFWPAPKAGAASARVVPLVGREGGGLLWVGAF